MSSATLEQYVRLLQTSGLMTKDKLRQQMQAYQSQGNDSNAAQRDSISGFARFLIHAGQLTEWQHHELVRGKRRRFFLGKYKLLRLIAEGGMSSIFLAEHVILRRRVALKVLPQKLVGESSYLSRFYQESRAAAKLDHPSIVRAFDVDSEGDLHYLVMEYIDGSDLQRWVSQRGPLSFLLAADCIRQAAAALEYAHSRNLVHRDIKPGNLLCDRKGNLKLLDLGLVLEREQAGSLTLIHKENLLGTTDYLSPEQAKNSHAADARSDLYSLGCTFYYLLTGRPPFPEGSVAERLLKHQTQDPPSIYMFRSDAPATLVDVCTKMMAKKPKRRFQTAAEVAEKLGHWLQTQGIEVPKQGPAALPVENYEPKKDSGTLIISPSARDTVVGKHNESDEHDDDDTTISAGSDVPEPEEDSEMEVSDSTVIRDDPAAKLLDSDDEESTHTVSVIEEEEFSDEGDGFVDSAANSQVFSWRPPAAEDTASWAASRRGSGRLTVHYVIFTAIFLLGLFALLYQVLD